MERMQTVYGPGMIGRLRQEQIAQQSTWTRVPEADRITADMHVIHVIPSNGSTETRVNPLDPGDGMYLEKPYTWDRVVPAGRMRF